MQQAAVSAPLRPGGEFFAEPGSPTHRRYEALRAYLLDGLSAADAAARFGYQVHALLSAVRDFRAGKRDFFLVPKPGRKSAPAKEAARQRVLELRRAGHSAAEIALALAATDTPLNRTGVAEIVREEGLPRLWPRPHAARGLPRREPANRASVLDFREMPARVETRVGGLLLAIPDLVEFGLPAILKKAGYPGTSVIPATSSILALLALKLIGIRRVSHVDDLATDWGAALFAGLSSLPKATALTTYSYRCDHERQRRLLQGLGVAMRRGGLSSGDDFDLDFHAVMHYGEDPVLEEHYVPRRSQRTASVLTLFAQDATTQTLVYANADLAKTTQAREVLAFCDHWKKVSGRHPALLVFDSRLTTQEVLTEIDARGIHFITLRTRSSKVMAHVDSLPKSAWQTVQLERQGNYKRPQVAEEHDVRLDRYAGAPIRQLAVRGLGREAPTILITNDQRSSAKQLIERYASRMNIEQRLAECIRSFHLDALSSAVPLNVDLDVTLSVVASATCAALRRRLPGYQSATPDTIQRRFLETAGVILVRDDEVLVRLNRRTYSPVLRQASIPTVEVPWWGGRRLRFEFS